jgi:putative ABC transport system permease protein
MSETIKVAFASIRANKLRSLLTMLGIIIGVGAVIAMVALGSGAQKAVNDRINSLGANLFTVTPGQSNFGRPGVAQEVRVSLTTDDAKALERDATLLAAVLPELARSQQVKYGNLNINVNILGTVPAYVPTRTYEIVAGRNFTKADDASRQRYAVLGADVPKLLNTNGAAMIGQSILIRGIPFEVIGVLGPKGSQGFFNPDEQIIIPLSTAQFRVFGTDRLRSISVQVKDGVPVDQGIVDVERVLRREHKIRPGGENDFSIRNPQDIAATQQAATQILGVLLLSIAGVSLVVGGIGIMNIMLVSVTERTREIGIRKALGATKATILMQFLIEALVLCVTGGLIGIMFGTGIAVALSRLFGWNTLVSPASIVIAFGFSAGVGLVFGILPAKKAASLDPIVALRYE